MTSAKIITMACLVGAALAFGQGAAAQVSNKPFAFSNGPGISLAGKEAITNRALTGERPRILLRGDDGRLVSVQRGEGGHAIVRGPDGAAIPSVRGRSFDRGAAFFEAGVFNAFFAPRSAGGRIDAIYLQSTASDVISTWTGQVVTDTPLRYGAPSSINDWTAFVYTMPGL